MSLKRFFSFISAIRVDLPLFAISVFIFLLSVIFSQYYIEGDQIYYGNAYNAVADLDFSEGYIAYTALLGSAELVHYLIIWSASGMGFDKNVVMAVANALLAYLTMRFFLVWRASAFMALIFVFTNFYILVIYFAAERLKFGFIFFLSSVLLRHHTKYFYAFAALSILSHAQMSILYISLFVSSATPLIVTALRTSQFRLKNILVKAGAALLFIGLMAFLWEHFSSKLFYYSYQAKEKSLLDVLGSVSLLIGSLYYSSNRLQTLLVFTPLIISTLLVGSDRVNMMSYMFFLFYALQYKRGLNSAVAATSIYFGIKSIIFITNVLESGSGF